MFTWLCFNQRVNTSDLIDLMMSLSYVCFAWKGLPWTTLFHVLWISPLIPLNEFRASEILKVATLAAIALSYLSFFINTHMWVWYCSVVHDDYISGSASQREYINVLKNMIPWCCPICLFLEGHPPYSSMCFALKPSFWSGISQRPALFDDTGGLLVHSWFHYLIEI